MDQDSSKDVVLNEGEISIQLNGEREIFPSHFCVSDLLDAKGWSSFPVGVELNLEIVPRSCYSRQFLKSGDCVEVVDFIGGG